MHIANVAARIGVSDQDVCVSLTQKTVHTKSFPPWKVQKFMSPLDVLSCGKKKASTEKEERFLESLSSSRWWRTKQLSAWWIAVKSGEYLSYFKRVAFFFVPLWFSTDKTSWKRKKKSIAVKIGLFRNNSKTRLWSVCVSVCVYLMRPCVSARSLYENKGKENMAMNKQSWRGETEALRRQRSGQIRPAMGSED